MVTGMRSRRKRGEGGKRMTEESKARPEVSQIESKCSSDQLVVDLHHVSDPGTIHMTIVDEGKRIGIVMA